MPLTKEGGYRPRGDPKNPVSPSQRSKSSVSYVVTPSDGDWKAKKSVVVECECMPVPTRTELSHAILDWLEGRDDVPRHIVVNVRETEEARIPGGKGLGEMLDEGTL